ncbi:S41 family peptidase [Patescibacteria group bacterium]|nr:S41 family peptidase [Patescibacteria group bacterium]
MKSNKSKLKKALYKLMAIFLLIFAGFLGGMYSSSKNDIVKDLSKKEVVYVGKVLGKYSEPEKGELNQDIDFKLFWELWDMVRESYVDQGEINDKKMFYGAMNGMIASIGDPYTIFMEPQEAREFEEDLNGKFEGIGAEIGIRDEILTIIAPLEGMPAEKAGLMSGDKVLAIDGEVTIGITIDEAVKKIRGDKGTNVTLTITRDGLGETQDITITRNTIVVNSLKTEYIKDKNIYKIKITNFNHDTINLMEEAVSEIVAKKPDGIIIDLRNNPGGYLEIAIELASEWVEDGIVVSEQFGDGKKNDFLARGRARLSEYKTIILVNQGSASASEILAGALRDYDIAKLIGKKTFGKGSVQSLENLSDGSQLKVTVAKWLTPDGYNINKEGLEPDFEVEYTKEDYEAKKDPQLDAAIEFLKTGKVTIKEVPEDNKEGEKSIEDTKKAE